MASVFEAESTAHDSDLDYEMDSEGHGSEEGRRERWKDKMGLKLEVKRIQQKWQDEKGRFTSFDEHEDDQVEDIGVSDAGYAFSIIRTFKPSNHPGIHDISTSIRIRSPHFVKAAKEVMKNQRNITWETRPIQFEPKELLAFLPKFKEYLNKLEAKAELEDEEEETMHHLDFFIQFLRLEYQHELRELEILLNGSRIRFDLLWGILIPGSILYAPCPVTGDPLAVRLVSFSIEDPSPPKPRRYELQCEFVDFGAGRPGLALTTHEIPFFLGVKRIVDLPVFPMEPYLEEKHRKILCDALLERGRQTVQLLRECCHKHYNAIAFQIVDDQGNYRKLSVKSRIIVDREMFEQFAPYSFRATPARISCGLDGEPLNADAFDPQVNNDKDNGYKFEIPGQSKTKTTKRRIELQDDELILMSPRVYGFSLGDRKWLEFRVRDVEPITWNVESFRQLDIPDGKKDLIKILIESHSKKAAEFSDFIEGKGMGLIFNLHGPPGVGKTLTAEASSEVAHSPLYIVGAGDLGTTASQLDQELTKVFMLAANWKAVVLIDEADVYLEKRELTDLQRNAMVAVFLRQLEYYPGILILTTNRVKVIDDAMKSRIHFSLRFQPLTIDTRARLWRVFLRKAGLGDKEIDAVDPSIMKSLCDQALNGREIKNIIKAASTFASYNDRPLLIKDVLAFANPDNDVYDTDEELPKAWREILSEIPTSMASIFSASLKTPPSPRTLAILGFFGLISAVFMVSFIFARLDFGTPLIR